MPKRDAPPPPLPRALAPPHSFSSAPPPLRPLFKQRSWSPDVNREEVWVRRKEENKRRDRRSRSVTDEDLEELRACFELGFGFGSDSPDQVQRRLSDTLPALGLYYAVNKQYSDTVSKSSSSLSSAGSDCDTPPLMGSPHRILDPGDDPEMVKTRLRQWAQVVACSVRQSPCSG